MNIEPGDLYHIARTDDYHSGHKYKWKSNYNGAEGSWCHNKEDAHEGGRNHGRIILKLEGGIL